jgi:hypothetical protein
MTLCEETGLFFRVGLDEPQLLAITVPLLDSHHFMTVDVRIRTISCTRHMDLFLLPDLLLLLTLLALLRLHGVVCRIHSGLVDAVAITHAVAIVIRLATLYLRPIPGMGMIAPTSLSASLRKPVNGQKNRCSDK